MIYHVNNFKTGEMKVDIKNESVENIIYEGNKYI